MRRARDHLARDAERRAYLVLMRRELAVLVTLECWALRLFVALVMRSDWRTGQGRTSYPQLRAMLTPIQPRRGPRAFVPTAQAIRRAHVDFEARGLCKRDAMHSEAEACVFFSIAPRQAQVRELAKLEGVTRRGVDNAKAAPVLAIPAIASETRRGNLKGSSTVIPFQSKDARATPDTATQRAMRSRVKHRTDPKK